MEPSCVSYNMQVISGSPTAAECELNNATHFEHPDDLQPWENYIYRGSKVSVGYNCKVRFVTTNYLIYDFIL